MSIEEKEELRVKQIFGSINGRNANVCLCMRNSYQFSTLFHFSGSDLKDIISSLYQHLWSCDEQSDSQYQEEIISGEKMLYFPLTVN